MSEFYPHRSALYMPGSNERALEKAKSLPADLFIFDMEDAVSPDNKERARDLILNVLSNEKADYRGKKILTRINSMDTVWANMDLECLQKSGTDGILFPKVSEVSDMLLIQKRLGELNFEKPPEIWIMAETPKCVLNLGKILASLMGYQMKRVCALRLKKAKIWGMMVKHLFIQIKLV